ncbi:MAG: DUF1801 domain-containing protein [Candidatus Thermoplasmatota archaeon]|nr:DUF1801 domain-containing protein [Candidatus Thermoplasmatota archaeon]
MKEQNLRGAGKGSTESRKRLEGGSDKSGDWRDMKLSALRKIILGADPDIIEEVKWKKPSNPEGVPVWSKNGIVCIGNILKRSVRLTFPKGAAIADQHGMFNSRLDSKTVRAIDFFQDDAIKSNTLRSIIRHAVKLNSMKPRK